MCGIYLAVESHTTTRPGHVGDVDPVCATTQSHCPCTINDTPGRLTHGRIRECRTVGSKDEALATGSVTSPLRTGSKVQLRSTVSEPSSVPNLDWLIRRGPDHTDTRIWHTHHNATVTLHASVLSMRDVLVPQPVDIDIGVSNIVDDDEEGQQHSETHSCGSCVLAWNGEVFRVVTQTPLGTDTDDLSGSHHSDTTLVADWIRQELTQTVSICREGTTIRSVQLQQQMALARVLERLVDADFAVTLVTPHSVFYARDRFGKRSLLVQDGLTTVTAAGTAAETSRSWKLSSVTDRTESAVWTEVAPEMVHCYCVATKQCLPPLPYHQRETMDVAPVQVLHQPLQDEHDKGNIRRVWTTRRVNDQSFSSEPCTTTSTVAPLPSQPTKLETAVATLYVLLRDAVRRRVTGPRVAVLFSGGLDSVVLAALALEILLERYEHTHELVLCNVSFVEDAAPGATDFARTDASALPSRTDAPIPPQAADTRAAMVSYRELERLFPQARICFLAKQATWGDIVRNEAHVRQLVHPQTTTMDLNIGMALWFASLQSTDSKSQHVSAKKVPLGDDCRVLLSGLGADELMGGYGRHRQAWKDGGNEQLRRELDLDLTRLWYRNLGRDDRVLSDTGREARFPYLDTAVVQFLSRLDLDVVCDFKRPPGEGDKRILRVLAAQMLGLEAASTAVKRAIQFGSRIAHVSDKRRFGSRRRASGTARAIHQTAVTDF
jgi:asparagine synthetase B (glutamine-hydrolysing)